MVATVLLLDHGSIVEPVRYRTGSHVTGVTAARVNPHGQIAGSALVNTPGSCRKRARDRRGRAPVESAEDQPAEREAEAKRIEPVRTGPNGGHRDAPWNHHPTTGP